MRESGTRAGHQPESINPRGILSILAGFYRPTWFVQSGVFHCSGVGKSVVIFVLGEVISFQTPFTNDKQQNGSRNK